MHKAVVDMASVAGKADVCVADDRKGECAVVRDSVAAAVHECEVSAARCQLLHLQNVQRNYAFLLCLADGDAADVEQEAAVPVHTSERSLQRVPTWRRLQRLTECRTAHSK